MKIDFLMNGLQDMEKLYVTKEEPGPDPFGGDGPVVAEKYCGADYCKTVLAEVVSVLPGVTDWSYQESFGRLANEVFVILTATQMYTLIFTIDTYGQKVARMKVRIEVEKREDTESTNQAQDKVDEYDLFLEQLKIKLKDELRKDWTSCSWVTDEQSERLAAQLYPGIFKGENNLRAFAGKVLVHRLGTNWLNLPGLEKYRESYKSQTAKFKRTVRAFANIDDTLIAMTMESLFHIIQKAKVYDESITLSPQDMLKLHEQSADDNKAFAALEIIRNSRTVKIDIWNDIFKQYFPEDAQETITNFINNRNHIAHNKLINYSAYQVMAKSIADFDQMIRIGNAKFEADVPSNELFQTWDAEDEMQREEDARREYEENYVYIRIAGETGVEVRNADGIFAIFEETLNNLYTSIYDTYYFDPRFAVSRQYVIDGEGDGQLLCSIRSNAVKDIRVDFKADISIDDDMDGDSYLKLFCSNEKGDEICCAELHYHNGAGYVDDFEGVAVATSDSEYDDSQLENLEEELRDYLDEDFNPLVKKMQAIQYEAGRHGGEEPVAYFPCWECDREGVSIMEDLYPIGHCIYCGTDNEVQICELCGKVYAYVDGQGGICNECLPNHRDD